MVGEKRLQVFAANTFLLFEEMCYLSKSGLLTCLCAFERMLALHFLIKLARRHRQDSTHQPQVCK